MRPRACHHRHVARVQALARAYEAYVCSGSRLTCSPPVLRRPCRNGTSSRPRIRLTRWVRHMASTCRRACRASSPSRPWHSRCPSPRCRPRLPLPQAQGPAGASFHGGCVGGGAGDARGWRRGRCLVTGHQEEPHQHALVACRRATPEDHARRRQQLERDRQGEPVAPRPASSPRALPLTRLSLSSRRFPPGQKEASRSIGTR